MPRTLFRRRTALCNTTLCSAGVARLKNRIHPVEHRQQRLMLRTHLHAICFLVVAERRRILKVPVQGVFVKIIARFFASVQNDAPGRPKIPRVIVRSASDVLLRRRQGHDGTRLITNLCALRSLASWRSLSVSPDRFSSCLSSANRCGPTRNDEEPAETGGATQGEGISEPQARALASRGHIDL